MKLKKDIVLDYIQKWSMTSQAREGLSTQFLSEKLDIQRSNVSRILNQLVKEGSIVKVSGRPVLYRAKTMADEQIKEEACFTSLIGYSESLKNGIQLAKAAILYPNHCLSTIIFGPKGSGKHTFAKAMIEFAIEKKIITSKAPQIHINCLNYIDDYHAIEEIFQDLDELFLKAQSGVLMIEHIELLPTQIRTLLLDKLEEDQIEFIFICTCSHDAPVSITDTLIRKISVNIHLCSYKDKNISERLELIQYFFSIESACVKKDIHINAELLYCLLMYDCEENIEQLQRDIRMGTATAYVREIGSEKDYISLIMDDFPIYVKRGILDYKMNRDELQALIPENFRYVFSQGNIQRENCETDYNDTIYDIVKQKADGLKGLGLDHKEISMIINADMKNEFKKYTDHLEEKVVNIEELSKIVDQKLITMVSDFLKMVSTKCERIFPDSILYGLCLHLHTTIHMSTHKQQFRSQQIKDIIEKYPQEYSLSIDFVSQLEDEYNIQLPIDEVIFITLFLSERFYEDEKAQRPVLLILMHGQSTATSISEAVNDLVKETIAYGFDMPLYQSSIQMYDLLKNYMLQIDRGEGMMVIYDMGSFKTMIEMIAQETEIKIYLQEIPITLLALDYARKCLMNHTLEEVYNKVHPLNYQLDSYYTKINADEDINRAVITLCMSGQGGAIQMKEYIEEVIGDFPVQILPLAISDKDELLKDINSICKSYEICSIVGTFNPRIYPQIPFVSVSDLFSTERNQLKKLLHLLHPNYLLEGSFYKNLEEQLYEVDMKDIRKLLPDIIDKLELLINEEFDQNQTIGLFIHIVCNIDHLLQGIKTQLQAQTDTLKKQYTGLFEKIKNTLKPLEKRFRIHFSDDDIVMVLSYMKKI